MYTVAYLGIMIVISGCLANRIAPVILGATMMGLSVLLRDVGTGTPQRVSAKPRESQVARLQRLYVEGEITVYDLELCLPDYLPPVPEQFPLVEGMD